MKKKQQPISTKQLFANFSYHKKDTSPANYQEYVVNFTYKGKEIYYYAFNKKGTSFDDVKKEIDKKINDGSLEKYAKHYIRKVFGNGQVALCTTLISLLVVGGAGVGTYYALKGNGSTPVSDKVALKFKTSNCKIYEINDPQREVTSDVEWAKNETAKYQIKVDSGFALPDKISFTFTGSEKELESGYSYDKQSGQFSVKMTDNITITASGNQISGNIYNIATWNEEFPNFVKLYVSDESKTMTREELLNPSLEVHIDGIPVRFIITPSDGNLYQNYLDTNLPDNPTKPEDERIDLFLTEENCITKYVNSPYSKNVKSLGVTDEDLAATYQYTIDAATDSNNVVKGVSFQSCPQVYIYRRSIAKDVFGTDDPETIQSKINTWEKFNETAKEVVAKNYYMTSSYDATYRTFYSNKSGPWVDSNMNLLVHDSSIETWIAQTKNYLDNKCAYNCPIWSAEWSQQAMADGVSLFYVGPSWLWQYSLPHGEGSAEGDWAVCQGPISSFWGGSWLSAAEGSDNDKINAKIMKAFTSDEKICSSFATNEGQFTNNKNVNRQIATSEYKDEFLGKQNPFGIMCDVADTIEFKNLTIYDTFCNEKLLTAHVDYFNNLIDKEVAENNFYQFIEDEHPEIITPLDPK